MSKVRALMDALNITTSKYYLLFLEVIDVYEKIYLKIDNYITTDGSNMPIKYLVPARDRMQFGFYYEKGVKVVFNKEKFKKDFDALLKKFVSSHDTIRPVLPIVYFVFDKGDYQGVTINISFKKGAFNNFSKDERSLYLRISKEILNLYNKTPDYYRNLLKSAVEKLNIAIGKVEKRDIKKVTPKIVKRKEEEDPKIAVEAQNNLSKLTGINFT